MKKIQMILSSDSFADDDSDQETRLTPLKKFQEKSSLPEMKEEEKKSTLIIACVL